MATSNRSTVTEGNTTLSLEDALLVMEQACAAVGLNTAGATLMQFGDNAMYRLASPPLMARVGRSVQASQKETHVARLHAFHEFPAVRPADPSSRSRNSPR